VRVCRPTYRLLRADPAKQERAAAGLAALKKAEAGELVLLSQDEARFPMVPTLTATLGVKGRRPVAGTRDCKDLLYASAVVNVVTAALHANLVDSPADAKRKTGRCKTRRLQAAFAAHLRHVGRAYPGARHRRVVLIIDNAPWHRGKPVADALADNPRLEFYRLPSYSPSLNVVERFRRVLRRRATHNRLFDTLADLRRSLRGSLCYFQTVRSRVASLVSGCYEKATASVNP
jgi:transposase